MGLGLFGNATTGQLVGIDGVDPRQGPWKHCAFVPDPLPATSPDLRAATYRRVADARAALAALDSTTRQLPNPGLLRDPTLRREAQSTSALEGTYEPLKAVLTADDETPESATMREVLNYVVVAEEAFAEVGRGRALTLGSVCELQRMLMAGTPRESPRNGAVRDIQVVIGRRATASAGEIPVTAARFVPSPPGSDLDARMRDLVRWINDDHRDEIDPVVAAAMGHYQFETLHPFHDGNGRIGRLLIVVQLLRTGTLGEPTLTVSPWFETRRPEYYDRLLAVSTDGDWDGWVSFFARGIEDSARRTHHQMLALVAVQGRLKQVVSDSRLRAGSAQALVDYAVAHPTFSVRQAQRGLELSYGRVNRLVGDLVDLGVLEPLTTTYNRRFFAPDVMRVLLDADETDD